MGCGCLYIVAGPIGNLKDITLRAIDILKFVDFIISEDTRETDKLLAVFKIKKSQISYRDQIHNRAFNFISSSILSGKNAALVSDSGTPLISDPGFKLIRDLQKLGIKIIPIPGASAVISALSVSGLPTDKFSFVGFLPKNNNEKKKVLQKYGMLDATLIIFESPKRVRKTLIFIYNTLNDRQVCLANDLTKIHEYTINQRLSYFVNNIEQIKEKGEYVILTAKEGF